jgi:hypothetical protein
MYSTDVTSVCMEVTKKLNLSTYDAETLIHDVNNLRGNEWLEQVESLNDDNLTARFKLVAQIIDESDETDCEDEYPTEVNYFVYDEEDEPVSHGYERIESAIEFATENGYQIIKAHNYYRDPNRGYKLYPDGYPEVVWGKTSKKAP